MMVNNCSAAKILPKRLTEPGSVTFKNSCQKAADTLSLTVDGKQKDFEESTTYANIKMLLKNIQKSSYFEKLNQPQQLIEAATELRKHWNNFQLWLNYFNKNTSINNIWFIVDDENSAEQTGDEKPKDDETNTATDLEENASSATDVIVEAGEAPMESGTVNDYQEAPSASAVPVPTFTPQQPHAVSTPGIAHSAPQNLKTLPQGEWLHLLTNFIQFHSLVNEKKQNLQN